MCLLKIQNNNFLLKILNMCNLLLCAQMSIVIVFCILLVPCLVFAQNSTSLPVATTLEVRGALPEGGEVVVYEEESETYKIATDAKDARVYGVSAVSPALVFSVGSGTVPVVTIGAAQVKVTVENGAITRGDLLISSSEDGVAMRAELGDDAVFAVALEDYIGGGVGTIVAEVGIEQARSLQESRREIDRIATEQASSTLENKDGISLARASIAALIALGGLIFILYSFRSTIAKGVVSIGRNPRARTSIMALAFGNIIFALILCAVVVFIAVGVLVLPI